MKRMPSTVSTYLSPFAHGKVPPNQLIDSQREAVEREASPHVLLV